MEGRLIAAFRKLPLAVKKRKLWLLEYAASAYDIDREESAVDIEQVYLKNTVDNRYQSM